MNGCVMRKFIFYIVLMKRSIFGEKMAINCKVFGCFWYYSITLFMDIFKHCIIISEGRIKFDQKKIMTLTGAWTGRPLEKTTIYLVSPEEKSCEAKHQQL